MTSVAEESRSRTQVDFTPISGAARRGLLANLPVAGHDASMLATDVHLPADTSGGVPVVLMRTAYGRSAHLQEGRAWARNGFAFVVQDVRGRYDSDGTWTPYRNERADGAALVDWLVEQSWCDGTVAAYGGSYAGYTAWAAAVERPQVVRQVISLGPSMGLHRTKFTPSGILRLAEHVGWWLERADGRVSREGIRDVVLGEHPEVLAHLPVAEIGGLLGVRLPHWGEALRQGREYGHEGSPPEAVTPVELAGLDCATLHVAGWFDLLLTETLGLWDRVGSAHSDRPHRSLLIGPWGHDLGLGGGGLVGALDHGPAAAVPLGVRCIEWLRRSGPGQRPPDEAHTFVIGTGRWQRETAWPPATRDLTLVAGESGALVPSEQSGSIGDAAVHFRYDPLDPFPSALPGLDRRPLLGRVDAARFGWTCSEPSTVQGSATIVLDCSTTAPATDWVARVLHRRASGELIEATSGTAVTRGVGRHGVEIHTVPVAWYVVAGEELLLEVTSSDFPYLARSLNTGEDRYLGTATIPAVQTIHLGLGSTTLTLPLSAGPPFEQATAPTTEEGTP